MSGGKISRSENDDIAPGALDFRQKLSLRALSWSGIPLALPKVMTGKDGELNAPGISTLPPGRRRRAAVLALLVLAAIGGIALLPGIPQDPAYHHFADRRTLLGIPNGLNVLSNLPLIVIGLAGLQRLVAARSTTAALRPSVERWTWALFFGAALLTGFGSGYYHWNPTFAALFWDRLPMALGFSSLLLVAVSDRISAALARRLALPLLGCGLSSVLYWRSSDDLKFYASLQFGSLGVILVLLVLFPPRHLKTSDFLIAIGLYGVAKIFEIFDSRLFSWSGIASGHTLKHLASAGSAGWVLWMTKLPRGSRGRPGADADPESFSYEGGTLE